MTQNDKPKKKGAPFITQLGIFISILWVSSIISELCSKSFTVPTPVIGLIILYVLLTFKIVKLEWVEDFGMFLIGIIGFLFVPSGIQIANYLNVLAKEGIQMIFVILVATVALLVITAYVARFIIAIHKKIVGGGNDDFD
ncbi:MAG: CidA/LrgA family protein [Limosilactobacillus sp.]|uniref:CidA/LrgA family protein n=1 Tax=Limosilactobacillus sp. TaxID=2773925 RepID=UPI002707C9C7|nr:CidA/LrgA family protein [Limosilactobacillus sp.]